MISSTPNGLNSFWKFLSDVKYDEKSYLYSYIILAVDLLR